MAHTIEPATSGRATCRGCGRKIGKGELRFGERFPNPYADEGDLTLWFHLACGAYKRPASFLEALAEGVPVEGGEALRADAEQGLAHRRLPRADGADRAPTGRATCRACREKIAKGEWRIRLVWFEDERFAPSGFIHAGCAGEYLGTTDCLPRLLHFADELDEDEARDLERTLSRAAD